MDDPGATIHRCIGFELAVAEEAAEYYELLELSQVIFYAMLLNKAKSLGVLQGQALRSLESALTELLTGSTKLDSAQRAVRGRIQEPINRKRAREWKRQMRTRPLRRRSPYSSFINTTSFSYIGYSSGERAVFLFPYMTFPPIYNTREMADYVRGSFIWRWRSASRLPRPLPEDLHVSHPRFSLSEVEGTAADFELPEIVQATFYTMLLNEEVELGVAHDFTAESMKSSLIGMRWSTFEV
ncbi:LOW QUALITY PROTEIN: hypothetical protein Cgig2_015821 [Carnegiea gigantea]|uniref:Uncharacterized protein n=1 Tax=Carnegiea gigantea TaxID=171969 RepID=A0A9Q1QKD3_9CARY|nr:LOW QUALITY PROTEIN: hypothetical protein Cgig2_015821 [Carnegiea gigantea]